MNYHYGIIYNGGKNMTSGIKSGYPTQEEMKNLEKYIAREPNKDTKSLEKDSMQWIRTSWENKLSYEVNWLGIPIIQTAEDIVIFQELIYNIQPDVIIETGIAHGGSLIFYASIMNLIGKGRVIGVDIDIREHNKILIQKHPMFERIEMIEASSVDFNTINLIRSKIKPGEKVVVILDSNHTIDHVYQELNLYQQFVSSGSYIVVCDTIMPDLAGLKPAASDISTNNARAGMNKFLAENSNFEVDLKYNKLYVTNHPRGFLKRT